jgi:hypothetical protein
MSEEEKTPQEGQEQEQKENKFQARINKLYGQKKEAEEFSANLEAENKELRSQMADLQERVSALAGRDDTGEPPAGPNTTIPRDQNDGSAGNLNAELVKNIVQDTVGSILSQRDEQVRQRQEIQSAHQKAWRSAVEEMPALADKNSELYQAAQAVWEKDQELRNSPAGPYKAAVMARGFLGSDSVSKEKLQSATMQSAVNQRLDNGSSAKEIEEIDTELADLKNRMASGEIIQRVWPRYRELRAKKAELLQSKNK